MTECIMTGLDACTPTYLIPKLITLLIAGIIIWIIMFKKKNVKKNKGKINPED